MPKDITTTNPELAKFGKLFRTPMILSNESGSYVPVEGPAQSHRHGIGRYAREAYGSKESCAECMEREKGLEEARKRMTK